jgi:hypothetical protein
MNQQSIPREKFNDDDVYVYDPETLRLVRVTGNKSVCAPVDLLSPGEGLAAACGLKAKYLGLWRQA